jgi:hypothetical protein
VSRKANQGRDNDGTTLRAWDEWINKWDERQGS